MNNYNKQRLELLYTNRPGPILDANKWYQVVGRFGVSWLEVVEMLLKVKGDKNEKRIEN